MWGRDWRPAGTARGTEPYCETVGQPAAHQHLLGLSFYSVTSENRLHPIVQG